MGNQLTLDEIEQLKEFRYSEVKFESDLSIQLAQFFEESKLNKFLHKLQTEVHAPDGKVTASMLMKSYGFFAVLNLFAMTILDKRFNLSLENVSIETNDHDDVWYWNPKFHFIDTETISYQEGFRDEWRKETINMIFSKHIYEILMLISKQTKISKIILWENIAIYIFWLYESVLNDPKFENKRAIIQDDFHYIIKEAEGSLFGPLNHNPLTKFYSEKVFRPQFNQKIRMRKTCCLYYLTVESGERCNTCPISCKKK